MLVSTLAGLLIAVGKMCYKSKCQSIDCFGIHILRDVIVEEEFDEQELNKLQKNDSLTI